jgi:hypothetical protein
VENHTVCQCPILRSDVEKVIEAADRDDYSVIVVGEKHLAIHHLTPVVEKIFLDGSFLLPSLFILPIYNKV